ncbi:hypothetical protein PR003_g17918 [Phytophthora rubi]|uniref:MULE transposase domain-containing protein n=2 Tax=Phytophthora rubi TaxID=129364 RepID=A0A6A3KMK5_9STRA|nr:hypothetical protein PR001_g17068 [Phytophthora rubi]KAE9319633.1 hypothetical protein PR003_g17918 [Phytophthora rubi]
MVKRLLWTPLAIGFSAKDADTLLETLKASKITKSEPVPCTVCNDSAPHNMRYRLVRCSCKACAQEAPHAKCPWRGKTLHCEKLHTVDIFETGKHLTETRAPTQPRLSAEMKDFARTMTAQGLTPVRIRNGIMRGFNLAPEDLPALAKVQRFCQHYASSKLGSNDYLKEMRKLVQDAAFNSEMDELESFTFTQDIDAGGLPVVGIGSDQNPFVVGITTKRLLMRASRDATSFILHVDATFKLNQLGYPVIVVGLSDCARAFHLVALFVSSQRKEVHYIEMFPALHRIYRRVTGNEMIVDKVLGDADDAQFNGIRQGFRGNAEVKYLMCFYHVIAKVFEKTCAMRDPQAKLVMSGVYDMHFALSAEEFILTKARVIKQWAQNPELATFSQYFQARWLTGRYTHWQVFHTARGWATTNNPVEQYNRTLKRHYTLHSRLKMGSLIGQFLTCCTSESLSGKTVASQPVIPASTLRRSKQLAAAKLLHEYMPTRGSIEFLLDDDDLTIPPESMRVISKPCPRVFDPEVGRTHESLMVTAQQGVHLSRMEIAEMPSFGWLVDTKARTCACRFYQKYAACIHLAYALSVRGQLGTGQRETLVYRGPNKKRRLQSENQQESGRPPQNGYALDRR